MKQFVLENAQLILILNYRFKSKLVVMQIGKLLQALHYKQFGEIKFK